MRAIFGSYLWVKVSVFGTSLRQSVYNADFIFVQREQ